MSDQDAVRRLREAVDQITAPSERRLNRDGEADWVAELAADPSVTVCDVAAYRAATVAYGKIPSLWQQAEWALTTGSEQASGGASPLRERSPADLDLMETMLTIRETTWWTLKGRQLKPHLEPAARIRQLSAHIVGHEPGHVEWWAYRFAQWARLLAAHVQALEHGPKPVRLRNAPCPICRTRQVTVKTPQGVVVAPPLLIDFVGGAIRAATCTACGQVWWRGADLYQLADALGDTPTTENVADSA